MSSSRHLSWLLSRSTDTLLPSLVRAGGLKAVRVIAHALNQEILSEQTEHTSRGKRSWVYDGSSFWLPSLTTKDVRESDLKSVLGWQLVEASRLLAETESRNVRAVVRMLSSFRPMVFRRIQLHILTAHIEGNVALAYSWLKKREAVRNTEMGHEYFALLKASGPYLSDTQLSSIAQLLESTSRTRFLKRPEQRKWAAQWLRDRLVALVPFLSGEWRDKYNAILAEEGQPEPVDAGHGPITTWMGPTSPKTEQELAAMSVQDIVEYLRAFVPKSAFGPGPSIAGLGRTLANAVEEAPDRFADHAELFRALDRTYVRAILDGFRNARRARKEFDWNRVLELALWIVEQPVNPTDVDDSYAGEDADSTWRWTRKSLVDLLSSSFQGERTLPFAARQRIWAIIENLAADVNPSAAHEAQYGGSNMDPYTLAINTVRPQAIDAAIQYAFWVRRNEAGEGASAERPEAGFSHTPEVARLLEQHLLPERDRSLAVRAAIGHWLASLVWFDASWVKRNWNGLFPNEPDLISLAQATWGAHVQYGRIYLSTYELEPMYRAALLHPIGGDSHDDRSPDNRLAQHIITFYWWGLTSLEDSDSLVALLFSTGSAAQTRQAIHHIGWSLSRTEDSPPADVLGRLKKLWDWRFSVLAAAAKSYDAATVEAAVEELEEFGHWFASKKFDLDWALPRFDAVVEITGGTERAYSALEVLAEIAHHMPLAAATTLEKFSLAAGKDPWRFHLWMEPATAIMQSALNSAEHGAREKATLLINKWIANVSPDFKRLLDQLRPGDGPAQG